MIAVTFRPLEGWPRPATDPRAPSPFSAGWSSTLDLLERELRALDAERIVVQLALDASQIRLDGWPYADARPTHPGVILSFESTHGPLRYVCDRYDARSRWSAGRPNNDGGWKANLRAIALGLEALRRVDRYGITSSGEQYRGWSALPAAIDLDASVETIRRFGGDFDLGNPTETRSAYRRALIRAHPDGGGSVDELEAVREAARRLGVA